MHYIYIFFLFVTPLFSAPIDLSCENYEQPTNKYKPWTCPQIDVGNRVHMVLSNVNVKTGEYDCEYRLNDTKAMASNCHYLSLGYKTAIERKYDQVTQNLNNYQDVNITTFSNNLVQVNKNFPLGWENKISRLSIGATDVVKTLNTFDPWNVAYKFWTTSVNISKLRNMSYTHLVKPYVAPGGGIQKGMSFSRFIVGLITLDSEIVEGYDGSNGKLLIQPIWRSKTIHIATDGNFAINIFDSLKNYFSSEQNQTDTINLKYYITNTNKWVSIFREHIWGFYYNLQRRLDIGFDVISTQLLFLMLTFFSMTAAARGSAKYITNRDHGQSSGEIKIDEATIMKTLGVLATAMVFYISIPTSITSTSLASSERSEIMYEMRTNASLIKDFIRYAMEKGSNFGTMVSDLGTDAFLEFIIQKQGLYSGMSEKNKFIESVREMIYYYPQLAILRECTNQFDIPLDRLASINNLDAFTINPGYNRTSSTYLDNQKLESLSMKLCTKMIRDIKVGPEQLSVTIAMIKQKLASVQVLRTQATTYLIENHIALQDELGWMNIISVPYTYFLMKHQELFFEKSLDFKDLESYAQTFTDNLGLRDGDDVLDNIPWHAPRKIAQERLISVQEIAKQNEKFTRFAFYNFLPSFTQIKSEIMLRLQSLYSDILRIGAQRSSTTKYNTYMKKYKELLVQAVDFSSKVYKGPYEPGVLKHMISNIEHDPIMLHQTILFVSYTMAMAVWKSGFIIVFLSAIAMIIGFKIVMYLIDVLIHFFVSPFMVLWAFTAGEGGATKIKAYLKDTLVYMIYPTIIVVGVFVFIFAYELFYSVYAFIINVLIEGQLKAISNVISTTLSGNETKEAMSYLSLYSLRDLTDILIDLLSVYVAFVTIHRFPELVLKMLGLGDSNAVAMTHTVEKLSGKGSGSVNPMSR